MTDSHATTVPFPPFILEAAATLHEAGTDTGIPEELDMTIND